MEPFEHSLLTWSTRSNRTASDHGYSVILSVCGPDPEREMNAIRLLLGSASMRSLYRILSSRILRCPQLQQIGVPVILLNRDHIHFRRHGNLDGARQAVSICWS